MNEGKVLVIILLICFLAGAVAFLIINKNRDRRSAAQNWLKYFTYFLIILSIYLVIFYLTSYFKFVCLIIILMGTYEIARLQIRNPQTGRLYFFILGITWLFFSGLFYSFSLLDRSILLLTFFTVSAFDAFSQVTGQLFGKRKIVPGISPNKTVGGFIGGMVLAALIALLTGRLLKLGFPEIFFLGIIIPLFAFAGDIAASVVKRKYNTKDFSRLIPGQGGFLDRFDSLIFAGSMVFILHTFI